VYFDGAETARSLDCERICFWFQYSQWRATGPRWRRPTPWTRSRRMASTSTTTTTTTRRKTDSAAERR